MYYFARKKTETLSLKVKETHKQLNNKLKNEEREELNLL